MRFWRLGIVGVVFAAAGLGDARAQGPAVPATAASAFPAPGPPASGEVTLALAQDGRFGAFLVVGPFPHARAPNEATLSPKLGNGWKLASSAAGAPVDVAAALDAKGKDLFAYAGGVLHVPNAGRHTLLLGADDGIDVLLDGQRVFAHDEARPQRDDDDLVPLMLTAGDHVLVFALHQRTGAWTFRARLLDAGLQPPVGASWSLPGTSRDDANALAARMSSVTLDRGVTASGYRPVLTVRFPDGAPLGVPLDVRARLARGTAGSPVLFDVDAGEVPIGERGLRDFTATLPAVAGGEFEDDDSSLHADVAGRPVDFALFPRKSVRDAIAHAASALALQPDESVEHLRDRLVTQVDHGDSDVDAQLADARELDSLATTLDEKRDPWDGRTGPMRRAYRSPLDGHLSEFALYVPPDFDPSKRYPLIVALHGMNGHPMQMLMWLFGHDDPWRDGNWEDRHPVEDLQRLPAIVVAPDGHFNAMYRDLGEEDVMQVVGWAMAHFPIDEARVTITGPSMGGIGTAACALHHPDVFAAAEPLCGYHSYFVRGDIGGRAMKPWEHFVAEERSNVDWAENGLYIPMFIVHGTKDLPEENSGVLIDRYEQLGYGMKHLHPDLGHNVWQTTYEGLKGASWLLWHQRPLHPRALRFKTPSTRWADDAWLHVREMASSDAWAEIFARIDKDNVVRLTTHGVDALALDRDAQRIDASMPVAVTVDHAQLVFPPGDPLELHKEGETWVAGQAKHAGLFKHDHVTGPLRDVLHEPLLVVWGASDPAQARANEEAAHAWSRVRWGVHVDYPIVSDTEFFARGEAIANDRALVLVGNARSNRIVRELEPELPVRIDGDTIVAGDSRIAATDGSAATSQLGVEFIHPNPRRPDRYVVVIEGIGPLGTWRSVSLPDMLPDWIVYDAAVGPARGGLILGGATVRAGGFFTNDWKVAAE